MLISVPVAEYSRYALSASRWAVFLPSVGSVLMCGLSSGAQDVKLLHAQAEKRGRDDASQHALRRPLRKIDDSRLPHYAEQRREQGHGSARRSFNVHLTPPTRPTLSSRKPVQGSMFHARSS